MIAGDDYHHLCGSDRMHGNGIFIMIVTSAEGHWTDESSYADYVKGRFNEV